jgi:NAD(P)-dependent dehydrogenase (short-subunit alcohol dehydrogenase family)
MFDFTEKVVLVTGATGSLGSAVAEAFHAAGARLLLGDRSVERLEERYGGDPRVVLQSVDLLNPEQVEAIIYAGVQHFGKIDVLANTVGGFRASRVQDMSLDDWDFMMDLNVRTAFIVSRAAVLQMSAQGFGKIVHVAARNALQGSARVSAYTASKSGVIRLVESLSAEVKDANINVNCVLPGTIDTTKNRDERPNADYSKWVPPAAIADVILFLASDAARAIHGAAVPVYGRS